MGKSQSSNGASLSRRAMLGGAASVAAAALVTSRSASAQPRTAASVGKYVTVDGNKIYYEERGRGVPIVMAAGGQNRVETLRPLAEKLAAKYRVITWDRANLGRSD